ncbi:hypothetical protein TNCV_958921 [Trichonephila clavipes]|nr:hypothetical protein TNCV_958921 [Trichonephila clavipes]
MFLQTELNSVAQQYTTEPISVNVTLSAGVHVQMFRLMGQSDAKTQCSVLSKLGLIYRPTEEMSRRLCSRELSPGPVA